MVQYVGPYRAQNWTFTDGIFENFNIDEDFIETLIKVWVDYLTVGNGYMEIGRNRNGTIGYVGHIPAVFVRVRRARDGFVQRAAAKFIFFIELPTFGINLNALTLFK